MDLAFEEDMLRYPGYPDFSLSGNIGFSSFKDSVLNDSREVQERGTNGEMDPGSPTGEEEEFATGCLSATSTSLNQLLVQPQNDGTYSMPPLIKTPEQSQRLSGTRAPLATTVLRLNFSQEFAVPILDRSKSNTVFGDSLNNFDRSTNSKMSDGIGSSEQWNFPLPYGPLGKRAISNDLAMSLDHLDLSNRSMLADSCQRLVLPFEAGTLPPPPPDLNTSTGVGGLDLSQDFSDSAGMDLLLALREESVIAHERDAGPGVTFHPKTADSLAAEALIYKPGSFQKNDFAAPWPENIAKSPSVVQAVYSEDDRAARRRGVKKDKTSIVMSSTRREWLSQLNGQTAGVRGTVVASGSVSSADDENHQLRKVMVVAPAVEEIHAVKPIFRVNVADLNDAIGNTLTGIAPLGTGLDGSRDLRNYALSKPTFSPFETGTMAFGTEEHPSMQASQPMLMITQVQRSATGRIKCLASCNLTNNVAGIEWLSSSELLVAAGSDLSIVKAHKDAIRVKSKLPRMHTDTIREIELSTFNRGHCLSGGYDGKVFVTDLERVIGDQISSRKESRNSLYTPASAVSSVKWNPCLANLASASTDSGFLHMFDTRLGYNNKLAIVIETGEVDLYTHAWADTYSTLLGYGDGALRLFDARRPDRCVVTFRDPFVSTIGDLAFDPQRRFFVSFGQPSFSVWRSQAHQAFTLWHRDPSSVSPQVALYLATSATCDTLYPQLQWDPYYKCSGAFMLTGGRQHGLFATTDAHGFVALYDVHTAEQAAVALDNSV